MCVLHNKEAKEKEQQEQQQTTVDDTLAFIYMKCFARVQQSITKITGGKKNCNSSLESEYMVVLTHRGARGIY
jgi:hypothetical protein